MALNRTLRQRFDVKLLFLRIKGYLDSITVWVLLILTIGETSNFKYWRKSVLYTCCLTREVILILLILIRQILTEPIESAFDFYEPFHLQLWTRPYVYLPIDIIADRKFKYCKIKRILYCVKRMLAVRSDPIIFISKTLSNLK